MSEDEETCALWPCRNEVRFSIENQGFVAGVFCSWEHLKAWVEDEGDLVFGEPPAEGRAPHLEDVFSVHFAGLLPYVGGPLPSTFCMDDGCRRRAGHDGPHDITWQAEPDEELS